MRAFVWGVAVSTAVGLVAVLGMTPTAWASGSPTPSSPSGPAPIAGFQTTVLSQSVAPSSKTQTFHTTSNASNVTISVPPGAFGNVVVQLVVTEPTLSSLNSSLTSLGLSGDTVGAGVGVEVLDSATGQALSGTFASGVAVTIQSSSITSKSRVIEYPVVGNPYIVNNATVTNGQVVVTVTSDPGFAVATPVSSSSVVPGATSPVTGKNFLPEAAGAGLLVVFGGSLMVASRRRQA